MERGFYPIGPYLGAKVRLKAKHLDWGGIVHVTPNSVRKPRTELGSCANSSSDVPTSETDAMKIMKTARLKPPLHRFKSL